jgi:hypothetical protein
MAHDVFISHAHKDKGIADAICEKLESARVRCWIAERDITAGDEWTAATRNAIESSRVMVLVLSENANAAPHLEGEIAHAFYNGRTILPLRLTDTLPPRNFLFYLGNIRRFDAFGLPAEQQLDAFTASINAMLPGPTASGDIVPRGDEIKTPGRFDFSDSSIRARLTPDSQNLATWKCAVIATALLGVVFLMWISPWQPKQEASLAESDQYGTTSHADRSLDPTLPPFGDAPTAKPADTSMRFGSAASPDIGPTPLDQREARNPDITPSVPRPASATPSPPPDVDQPESAEAGSPGLRDGANERSAGGDHTRTANRQEVHQKKARLKHHIRKVSESDGSLVRHFKSRLKTVWRQIVVRTKEIGD